MAQHLLIGSAASRIYRPLHAAARLVGVALALGIAVIGLLAATAAPPLVPSWSTVMASTRLQPSAAPVTARSLMSDQASHTNDDGYLEGLVTALDRNP
jgi:hypothetical protein